MSRDSIPRAVASGAATHGAPDDPIVPVRPARVGLGAGVLAAVFLLVLFRVHAVPPRAVLLVGGSADGLARFGGLRMTWDPPRGYDAARAVDALAEHDTEVALDGTGGVIIEIARVSPPDAAEMADRLTNGQVEFHEVVETAEMKQLSAVLHLPMHDQAPVDLAIDQWRPEEGGASHSDAYLWGERAAIEAKLAEAATLGWALPAHTHIAYEHVEGLDGRMVWRTYVVSDTVELSGDDIARATGAFDPNTQRPIVLLDFTRGATARFGDLTARITGQKLATMVGGEVRSAPIINGPIRGGRASITMGGSDPRKQEHERDVLVATLSTGALPMGGHVRQATYVQPSVTDTQIWLARLLVGLGGGLGIGLLAFGLVRVTRPIRRRAPPRAAGAFPWLRVLVTLIAPALVLVETWIPLPGVDRELTPDLPDHIGVLGLSPILAAYVLVELVAMIVPGWRRRRHAGPEARRPIELAVVAVAVALVGIQGWFFTTYLESFDMIAYGRVPKLEIIGALGLGTAAYAAGAHLIRTRGLGNGYTALVAASWSGLALGRWFDLPVLSGDRVLTALTIVAIAVPLATVLRWRIGDVREAALRVPTAGTVALSDAGGLAVLAATLGTLPFLAAADHARAWADDIRGSAALAMVLVCVLTAVWSFVFARPGVVRTIAQRVGLAPPTMATWLRATALTGGLLIAFAALAIGAREAMWIAEPATLALVVATALDAYRDLRGHRGALELVWTVHQVQHADLVERHLADAEIPCHLSASHVRTLLAWFGPFAPIDVWVAPAQAAATRARLAALFAR